MFCSIFIFSHVSLPGFRHLIKFLFFFILFLKPFFLFYFFHFCLLFIFSNFYLIWLYIFYIIFKFIFLFYLIVVFIFYPSFFIWFNWTLKVTNEPASTDSRPIRWELSLWQLVRRMRNTLFLLAATTTQWTSQSVSPLRCRQPHHCPRRVRWQRGWSSGTVAGDANDSHRIMALDVRKFPNKLVTKWDDRVSSAAEICCCPAVGSWG